MRLVPISLSRLALATMLAATAGFGCAGEPGSATTASGPSDAPPPPPKVGQEAPPPPPLAGGGQEPAQLRRVIGQTTTDVRDFDAEMQGNEDVRVSDGKITAKDPITIQGNAYVSMVGRAAVLKIEHAVNLYHAANDRYPADFDEFKREILDPNGIALPQLPGYQEYAYKADTHELVVLEYPDRKEELRKQVYGEAP